MESGRGRGVVGISGGFFGVLGGEERRGEERREKRREEKRRRH
jgi:hypothetical protein